MMSSDAIVLVGPREARLEEDAVLGGVVHHGDRIQHIGISFALVLFAGQQLINFIIQAINPQGVVNRGAVSSAV